MIDELMAGEVFGDPQRRTGKSGEPLVVAKVRAPTGFLEPATFAES